MRWGMVIDLKRCIGCNACTIACKMEHGTPRGIFYTRTVTKEVGTYPQVTRIYLPILCNHCKNAPCERVCPTGATYRREDGLVLIDHDKCVGCRACYVACPYKSRSYMRHDLLEEGYFRDGLTPFEEVKYRDYTPGVVVKCTLCAHRIDEGLEPACVVTCPTEARVFGDMDDQGSKVRRLTRQRAARVLLPECDTEPSVYYIE